MFGFLFFFFFFHCVLTRGVHSQPHGVNLEPHSKYLLLKQTEQSLFFFLHVSFAFSVNFCSWVRFSSDLWCQSSTLEVNSDLRRFLSRILSPFSVKCCYQTSGVRWGRPAFIQTFRMFFYGFFCFCAKVVMLHVVKVDEIRSRSSLNSRYGTKHNNIWGKANEHTNKNFVSSWFGHKRHSALLF